MIRPVVLVVALVAAGYSLGLTSCATTGPPVPDYPASFDITVFVKGGWLVKGALVTIDGTHGARTDGSGFVSIPWTNQPAVVRVEVPRYVPDVRWRFPGAYEVTLYPYSNAEVSP